MRIGIAGIQTTELVAKSIKETLSDAGFESFILKIILKLRWLI